jgi:hypothetical protein
MSDTRPAVDHVADHAVVFLTGEVDLAVEGEVLEAYRDCDRPDGQATASIDVPPVGGRDRTLGRSGPRTSERRRLTVPPATRLPFLAIRGSGVAA